ncbi:MAG: YlxR family protein [Clostridiales bacterium]|nr:YlxR family protein [Clostridiales bacterium]
MKQVLRMCMSCKKKVPKQDLIRVVRTDDNKLYIDTTYKIQTRGAYICKDNKCIGKVRKGDRLARLFSIESDESFYDKLQRFVES